MIPLFTSSPYFFTALGSLCYVLCFPKWNLIVFAPFIMPFFLLSIERISTKKSALWCSLIFSFSIGCGGFYWITHLSQHFGGFPLWLALLVQFFFGLVVSPQSYCFFFSARSVWTRIEAIPLSLRPVFWAGLYTLAEFLARKVKIFPENLGNTMLEFLPLAQAASLAGVAFLTFLPLWWGSSLFYSIRKPKETWWLLGLPSVAIASLILWGNFEIKRVETIPTENFRFAFLQHNQEGRRQAKSFDERNFPIRTIISDLVVQSELLLRTAQEPVDLMLWPETAYPIEFPTNKEGKYSPYVQGAAAQVQNLIKKWNVPLLFGGYEMQQGMVYNSAIFLDSQGMPQTSYRKQILLIFGEYIPFQSVLTFLTTLLPDSGGFGAGPGAIPVTLNLRGKNIGVGINICYEAIIPEYIRELANGGIHLFINLTKDSWYGDTAEPWQHFQLTALRAIEFRVPLVRITDSGLSGIVSSTGKVKLLSGPYETARAILDVPISFAEHSTLYARWGDWFAALLFPLLAMMIWNPFPSKKSDSSTGEN